MMRAVRDRAGLTVTDERGVIVAITTDRDEAGTFVGDEAAWLATKGLRRDGAWMSYRPPGRPGDMPADYTYCDVERIEHPSWA